jgi:hypothetical protein
MHSGFEIAGSCLTLAGSVWLSIDAFLIRRNIRSEEGAARLGEILTSVGLGTVLKNDDGRPLDSRKALRLWFASRTIAWNWMALGLVAAGFLLDLIGKLSY